MANGDTFNLLFGYNSTNNAVVVVEFHKSSSGQYQLHSGIRDDASTWTYTSYVTISDDVHLVEIDWQASTGAGANNGTLAFYLDGALQQTVSGIDNDTRSVDYVRLGAVSSLDATTSGIFYLDAFESHTISYIGPAYGAALPLYTGRGSVTAYIGGSASLPYSYGISTPYPTPTSQPGITTSTYSYAAQSGTCPDGALSAKPHAVTSVGSDTYCYDKNGNMVKRVEGGTTYTQVFDIENRLSSVTVGGVTTSFVYDGDGNLVKKVKGTTTTVYVGMYEVELNNSTVTKRTTYYPLGGAMRVDDVAGGTNTVYYMLKDYLGAASVLLKSDGTIETNGEQRYYPFGESRITNADLKTAHLFTSQLSMGSELGGIYHYGARFYSSKLGRFLSADTIVPNWKNPQSLNRYAYVYNNPLKYVDPTGHEACYGTSKNIGTGEGEVSQADCWAAQAALIGLKIIGQINKDIETIFFSNANTTFEDRLAASTRIGGLSVGAAAVAIAAGSFAVGGEFAAAITSAVEAAGGTLTTGWTRAVLWCATHKICWAALGGGLKTATKVSEGTGGGGDEISIIESHLARFGNNPENDAMVDRLKAGNWTQWDQIFYQHELIEADLMNNQGITDEATAHLLTLDKQGIAWQAGYEAYLYHPDVISEFSDRFSPAAQTLAKLWQTK